MANATDSKLLVIYEKSIFAKLGAKVSSVQKQNIPASGITKDPKKIDLVAMEKDFMKIVVEPNAVMIGKIGVFGNIVVNPTQAILSIFNKLQEPVPVVLNLSDKLIGSKLPTLSIVPSVDLLKSPMQTPGVQKTVNLLTSPMDAPGVEKTTDLLNSPIDTVSNPKTIDLLNSPMATTGKIPAYDLTSQLLNKFLGVDDFFDRSKQYAVGFTTSPTFEFSDFINSNAPLGIVTKGKEPESLLNTPWSKLAPTDFFDIPKQYAEGFTLNSQGRFSDYIANNSPVGIITRGKEPDVVFNTPWSTISTTDYFDVERNYSVGFTKNAGLKDSNFLTSDGTRIDTLNNLTAELFKSVSNIKSEPAIPFSPKNSWTDFEKSDYLVSTKGTYKIGQLTSQAGQGAGVRQSYILLTGGGIATQGNVSISGKSRVSLTDPFYWSRINEYNGLTGIDSSLGNISGFLPKNTSDTTSKFSDFFIRNAASARVKIGSLSGFSTSYGSVLTNDTYKGVSVQGYSTFGDDPWYWSRIRETAGSKGMNGILTAQGNINSFIPLMASKTSQFTYLQSQTATGSLGNTGGSFGVKQSGITSFGIPPQGQASTKFGTDSVYYWSKIRGTDYSGIESNAGNIDSFIVKSPYTNAVDVSDYYLLNKGSIKKISNSGGTYDVPINSPDGKSIKSNQYGLYDSKDNVLYAFNLDARVGVLNQYSQWSTTFEGMPLQNFFKEIAKIPAINTALGRADAIAASPILSTKGQTSFSSLNTPLVPIDDIRYPIGFSPLGFGRYGSALTLNRVADRLLSNLIQTGIDLKGYAGDLILSSLEKQAYILVGQVIGIDRSVTNTAVSTSFPLQVMAGPIFQKVHGLPETPVVIKDFLSAGGLVKIGGSLISGVVKTVTNSIPSVKQLNGVTSFFGVSSDAVMKQAVNNIQTKVAGALAGAINSLIGKALVSGEKLLMIQQILMGTKYTAGTAFYDPQAPQYNAYYSSYNTGPYAYNRYSSEKSGEYGLDHTIDGTRDLRVSGPLQTLETMYLNLDPNTPQERFLSVTGADLELPNAGRMASVVTKYTTSTTSEALNEQLTVKKQTASLIVSSSSALLKSKLFKGISGITSTDVNYPLTSTGNVSGNPLNTKINPLNTADSGIIGKAMSLTSKGVSAGLGVLSSGLGAIKSGIDHLGLSPLSNASGPEVSPLDFYSRRLRNAVQNSADTSQYLLEDRGFPSAKSSFMDVKNAMDLASYPSASTFQDFDLVDFYFEDASSTDGQSILIPFRAIIQSYNDNVVANWSDFNYVGRPDKFYIYQGFERKVDIGFDVAVQSKSEIMPIWRKLNYLSGMCYPVSYPQNVTMKAPIVKITIGSLMQRVPAILNSFSFSLDNQTIWELQRNMQLPAYIRVIVDFTILFSDIPVSLGKHFGQSTDWISPLVYNVGDLTGTKTVDGVMTKYRSSNSKTLTYVSTGDGSRVQVQSAAGSTRPAIPATITNTQFNNALKSISVG